MLLLCALLFTLLVTPALASERFPFDPEITPDNTMNYVVLQGSWYDMGYQYGQQDPTSVVLTAISGTTRAMQLLGITDAAELQAKLVPYEDLLQDWFPQLLDFCHGMADSLEMDYYDVLTGYIACGPWLADPDDNSCSQVAAWGEATGNGDLVAAYNSDRPLDASAYQSCIIALPEDGNAFICARDFMGPTMNECGLVVQSTGGQHALPSDLGFGIPYALPIIYAAAFCSTAQEAYDAVDPIEIAGDMNLLIADGTDAYVLEITSGHKAWRATGDFGEQDYIIANNHFLTDEMQSSLMTDHSYDDCPYRYATVEQFLLRDFGAVTVNTLREAEGSTSFYDFEADEWRENVWDPMYAYHAPEALSDSFKTVISHVANATTQTVYECRGQQETLSSYVPYALGTYSQVTLDRDVPTMVSTAARVLGRLLVRAAADMDLSGNRNDPTRLSYLNQAREQNYIGYNYQLLAVAESDADLQLQYYVKALNAFCDGQCFARLASDDPSFIE